MARKQINLLYVIAWLFSSILLLLVQLGYISPIGFIVITQVQYVWLFWISAILFIFTTAFLVARVRSHPKWTIGFTGDIVRTVRISNQEREYFIRGKSDSPIRDVLLDAWPFSELDSNAKWYVADSHGNDITNKPFGSIDGTANIIIGDDSS